MTFAQRLQELRKEAGLSQEALAERLGVSRQSVSKWELGQAYPETEKIIEISRMFGASLDVLLKGEEAPPSEPPQSVSGSRFNRWLGVLAVLLVAAAAFIFMLWPKEELSPSEHGPAASPSESVPPPAETLPPPSESLPAQSTQPLPPAESTAPPAAQPESGMETLREYYFDFARQYRLDYVPFFERYALPWESPEYLMWAFAINLEGWGEDKGTMTEEYVDGMVLRHFGQRELEHQSMHKCWNYDGSVYTAVPGGIKEQPLYFLTDYTTYEENGIRYHEITLEYLLLTSGMIPTPEEDTALRARIISGSTDDLYALHRETFKYHMSATDPGVPVFDCHTLLSSEP